MKYREHINGCNILLQAIIINNKQYICLPEADITEINLL